MAQSYPMQNWADGETLSPRPVMAEIASLAGECNGHVDRDNVGDAALGPLNVELGAWHTLGFTGFAPQVHTRQVSAHPGQLYPLDESINLECEDGRVHVIAELCASQTITGIDFPYGFELCILVDGQVITSSDVGMDFYEDCVRVCCSPAVAAGVHRLGAAIRIAPSIDNAVTLTNPVDMTVTDGIMVARQPRR